LIAGAAASSSNVVLPTVFPEACTNPQVPATAAERPKGICNIRQGDATCCDKGGRPGRLEVNLPDIRNCSATCQSFYISYWCFYSCSGQNPKLNVCDNKLRQLFDACQSCNILNRGVRIDATTDYNAFLRNNSITTTTTACVDFLPPNRRRCVETQPPTITRIQVTEANSADVVTAIAASDLDVPTGAFAAGEVAGKELRVCARVRNVRPENCEILTAGVGLYPISVRIVIQATGTNVNYVMADATFQSSELTQPDTNVAEYDACISDFKVTSLIQGDFNLEISATAVNTFGTANSNGLSDQTNQILIPVNVGSTFDAPQAAAFTLGTYTDAAYGVFVCNNAPAAPTTNAVTIGTTNWAVPNLNNAFKVNTVNCCEEPEDGATAPTPGDGYTAQCTIFGSGLDPDGTNALRVATFETNVRSTTLSNLWLEVGTTFAARGSITLVNTRINLFVDAQLGGAPSFAVTGTVDNAAAIRGAAGNLIVIGSTASVDLTGDTFLILLDHVEFSARRQSEINIDTGRFIVAEMAQFTTSKSTTTFANDGKIAQYTTLPGRVRFGGNGLTNGGTVNNAGSTLVTGDGAVVAVSGTLFAYNLPTAAGTDEVRFNVPVRISKGRGPGAEAPAAAMDPDARIIPVDALIPGQIPPLTPEVTKKGFNTQANNAEVQIATPSPTTAVLHLCGTRHTAGITIPAFGKLLVAPVAESSSPCRIVEGGVSYSLITNSLTVEADGIVEIGGVATNPAYYPIRVTGALTIANAQLRVTLASGIQTTRIDRLPVFSLTACPAVLPRLVVTNAGNRVVELGCTTIANVPTIFLSLSEVQTVSPSQVNPALFTSNNEYCIIVSQQLDTFTRQAFVNAITTNFPTVTTNLISIVGFGLDQTRNNQIRINFRCLDFASAEAADQRCTQIVTSAQTPGSQFRTDVLATSSCTPTIVVGADDNDDSNHGLYGLFGLIAIPILCCLIIFLVVRNSRRRADNQYMQDAATFSNVASGPQPIAAAVPAAVYDYDYPKAYPAGPVVAVPAY